MARTKLAFAALALTLTLAAVKAFQGMATPGVRVGAVKTVRSDLPPIRVDFRDVAAEAGLTALDVSGSADNKQYILEATGHGVTIFDYDNDGLMDVFLVNGTTFDAKTPGPPSHLYHNKGGLKFEDVTEISGLAATGWGQGACAADYDNDGRKDLFVTYYGHSVLYHNEGGGKFRDVTKEAGLLGAAVRWDTGCTFFDYDLDGKLDLAVTGYIDFDKSKVPKPGAGGFCVWKGLPVMCGPRGLPTGRHYLFHNEGNGKFRDVSEPSGVAKRAGCYGFTITASDFDGDGYPDLYVACDSTPSLLYHNKKNGTFEETGIVSGVALNEDGREQAGMGVAVADYDEDGFPDIAKTNFSDDVPNLYHNDGKGNFVDTVYTSGLATHSQYLGWGINFLDVDHDGRKELFVVNGHVYPEVDRTQMDTRFRQPRLLYWNIGGGRFQDISNSSGAAIGTPWSSRGSAVGDLDNDGSLEIVVSNLGARPSLLKNFAPAKNWLLVNCVGTTSNRDAIGAQVRLYVGGRRLSGQVQNGASFLSQNDPRVHFGVGDAASYDRIEVRWPNGVTESFRGGSINRIVTVEQGSSRM
jgi:hypothetical protein